MADNNKSISDDSIHRGDEVEDVVSPELPHFSSRREKTLSDLSGFSLENVRSRQKQLSDFTGMALPVVQQRLGRGDRRTVSDLVAMLNLPNEKQPRSRQASSSDTVQKMRDTAGTADLRMAEEILATGTWSERQSEGVSEDEHMAKINKKPEGFDLPPDFVFSHGLSSEEAEERLTKYGRNELPENVEPKWLLFLKQFWAPMPIMIWIAIIIESGVSLISKSHDGIDFI